MASKKASRVLVFPDSVPESVPDTPKVPLPIPSKRRKPRRRGKRWNAARLFVVGTPEVGR